MSRIILECGMKEHAKLKNVDKILLSSRNGACFVTKLIHVMAAEGTSWCDGGVHYSFLQNGIYCG